MASGSALGEIEVGERRGLPETLTGRQTRMQMPMRTPRVPTESASGDGSGGAGTTQ